MHDLRSSGAFSLLAIDAGRDLRPAVLTTLLRYSFHAAAQTVLKTKKIIAGFLNPEISSVSFHFPCCT